MRRLKQVNQLLEYFKHGW